MKIKLSKLFYDKAAVTEAIKDFKEVCSCNIINDSIEIVLHPKERVENIEEEFCNYVLGLMNNKTLI